MICLHIINKRATPNQFCRYKHSLLVNNLFNKQQPKLEWIALNVNQNTNSRNKTFKVYNNSNHKVGKDNKISNRLACINFKILLDWLSQDWNHYKLLSKNQFLSHVQCLKYLVLFLILSMALLTFYPFSQYVLSFKMFLLT